jgi:hypothetical protein
MFPDRNFSSDNLLVLLQPQLTDMGEPIDFAVESYMESLRDLARFIDGVCRTKRSPGFAWMNALLTHIARLIHRLPGGAPVNISDTLRLICTFQAEEIWKSVIAGQELRAKQEIGRLTPRNFPFDGLVNPQLIEEAVQRFRDQCRQFSSGLLDEIPDKADCLQKDLRAQVLAAWQKQLAAHRVVLLQQMSQTMTTTGQQLARDASNDAVNAVNGLTLQTALDCASTDPFCERAIATAVRKLTLAAENIHPHCAQLIADRFGVLRANIERDVRAAVDPHWQQKKRDARAWQAAENDKQAQAQLAAQAE